MTIGVRAHDFGSGDFAYFDSVIRKIASVGYQSLQLAPAKSITEIGGMEHLNEEHLARIKNILLKHQIIVSVLGCYLDFTAEDEEVRKKSVALFKRYIKYAKFLSAKMIATETSYGIVTDEQREEAMGYVVEAFQEIMPIAEEEGVLVAIEPVAHHALNTPELTRELLETISSDNLKILYDQTNLLTPKTVADDAIMFERAKKYLGDDVIALHIKNFVVKDREKQMVALDSGVVNFPAILEWASSLTADGKRNVEIIREDSTDAYMKADLAYIKSFVR